MEKLVLAENELQIAVEKVLDLTEKAKIIVFRGELGAGKTTLIKNICNFLKVIDEVNSPTFSIVNEYETEAGTTVYHFDFYRIEDEVEALDIGVEDYFYSDNLCLIEWPSKVENLLPDSRVEVEIKIAGDKREFIIK